MVIDGKRELRIIDINDMWGCTGIAMYGFLVNTIISIGISEHQV